MALRVGIKQSPNNKQVVAALRNMPQKVEQTLLREVDSILLDVLADSKTVYPRVPVDTGALQSTGRVEKAQMHGTKMSGAVVYGGWSGAPWNTLVGYAEMLHEWAGGPKARFRRPGSGPKFVSAHFLRRKQEFGRRIRAAIKRGLGL